MILLLGAENLEENIFSQKKEKISFGAKINPEIIDLKIKTEDSYISVFSEVKEESGEDVAYITEKAMFYIDKLFLISDKYEKDIVTNLSKYSKLFYQFTLQTDLQEIILNKEFLEKMFDYPAKDTKIFTRDVINKIKTDLNIKVEPIKKGVVIVSYKFILNSDKDETEDITIKKLIENTKKRKEIERYLIKYYEENYDIDLNIRFVRSLGLTIDNEIKLALSNNKSNYLYLLLKEKELKQLPAKELRNKILKNQL